MTPFQRTHSHAERPLHPQAVTYFAEIGLLGYCPPVRCQKCMNLDVQPLVLISLITSLV